LKTWLSLSFCPFPAATDNQRTLARSNKEEILSCHLVRVRNNIGTVKVPPFLMGLVSFASLNLIAVSQVRAQIPVPPNADKVSPTVSADISSEITTGSGYDAWTGSVRRRVVDIEIPGAVSSQGLKYVRTYSSSTGE
jgi:hypothetical protein